MPCDAVPCAPSSSSSSLTPSCTAMTSIISSLAALLGLRSARAALRACLAGSRGARPARLACECERWPCPPARECTLTVLLLRRRPLAPELAVLAERFMRVAGGAAAAAPPLPSEVRLRCDVDGAGAVEVEVEAKGGAAKVGGGGAGGAGPGAREEGDEARGMARSHTTQNAPKSRSSMSSGALTGPGGACSSPRASAWLCEAVHERARDELPAADLGRRERDAPGRTAAQRCGGGLTRSLVQSNGGRMGEARMPGAMRGRVEVERGSQIGEGRALNGRCGCALRESVRAGLRRRWAHPGSWTTRGEPGPDERARPAAGAGHSSFRRQPREPTLFSLACSLWRARGHRNHVHCSLRDTRR